MNFLEERKHLLEVLLFESIGIDDFVKMRAYKSDELELICNELSQKQKIAVYELLLNSTAELCFDIVEKLTNCEKIIIQI